MTEVPRSRQETETPQSIEQNTPVVIKPAVRHRLIEILEELEVLETKLADLGA